MTYQPRNFGLQFDSIGGGLMRVAFYKSLDPIETVLGAGYFVDAERRGGRVGDLIIVYDEVVFGHFVLAITAISATGAATVTWREDFLTPEQFGVNPGVITDPTALAANTVALQRAFDASGTYKKPLLLSGAYYVVPQLEANFAGLPLAYTADEVCLFARSYMSTLGKGKIIIAPGTVISGSGAIIGSDGAAPIVQATFRDIEIDGTGVAGAGQLSGLTLVNPVDCLVDAVNVHDVSGFGVAYLATYVTNTAPSGLRSSIKNCVVKNTKNIPIEAAHTLAQEISGNTIDNRTSAMTFGGNGIDIYGVPQAPLTDVMSYETIISNNKILGGWNGIFVETAQIVIVNDNLIDFIEAYDAGTAPNKGRGIWINSATAFAYDVQVQDNTIRGKTGALCGIDVRLGTKVQISGNKVYNFKHGARYRDGANGSYVGQNTFDLITDFITYPERGTIEFVRSFVDKQIYLSSAASGWPKAYPDPSEPALGDRNFNVQIADAWSVYDNAPLSRVYWGVAATVVLADGSGGSPSWGAYSIFSGGETLVYTLASAIVGEYVRVNLTYYLVHAVSGSQVTIRSTDDVAADYTADTNGAYPYFRYSAANYARMLVD